jgi:hypothetical protein
MNPVRTGRRKSRHQILISRKRLKAKLPLQKLCPTNKAIVNLRVSLVVAHQAECNESTSLERIQDKTRWTRAVSEIVVLLLLQSTMI